MATDDDADVPETGAIFTFGKSKFGDNAPNKFWIRNDKVVQVACGDEHTALVAESGRIFTFGANDWGQLGLGHTKPSTKPSCIKSLKKEKVKLVACGRSTTYVATESGKLFSFGANGDSQLGIEGERAASSTKPLHVESLEEQKYQQLAAGTEHAVALTESGDVYVWGCGSEGQLGLGPQVEVPTPLQLPLEERAVCISCGYYHTAIVTEDGKLYTFGETEGGKLGRGEEPDEHTTPQEVEGIDGNVVWVACGGSHTVAVTEKGKVYSFGDGSNGQLGHGTLKLQVSEPHMVPFLKDRIKKASCGENHTALISDRGQMYTFGDGRHGKLGLGEENFANQFKPSQLSRFAKFVVENVSCGGCHMLVLAKPKIENGDWDSGNEDEGEDETDEAPPANKNLQMLRQSNDLDLSGSFSARDRRREKQDNVSSLGRTLPALNTSMSGRALPPLNSTLPAKLNPINKAPLAPLRLPNKPEDTESKKHEEEAKKRKDEEEDSDVSVTESDEEDEEDHRKREPLIKKTSEHATKNAPVPLPRGQPRLTKSKPPKEDSEEEEESEEESDEEEVPKKPLRGSEKSKPVPALRGKKPLKQEDSEEESEEEDSEEEEQPKKKPEKKAKEKGKKKDVKHEESEEEEESEPENKRTAKGKEKDKDKKKRGVGFFGRRKQVESEEEEEEEEEEESEEEDLKGKKKNDQKDKKEKEKEKIVQSKKDDKKVKENDKKDKDKKEESDEETEDEDDKENKKEDKKKDKKDKKENSKKKEKDTENEKEDEEKKEDDDDKEETKENLEQNGKLEKKEEDKKEEKKKSKLCVIL